MRLRPALLLAAACGEEAGPDYQPVGGACDEGADCEAGLVCVREDAFPGGACSRECDDGACPEGAVCAEWNDVSLCLAACAAHEDCRDGYQCLAGACAPGCASDDACGLCATCETGRCGAIPGALPGEPCGGDGDCCTDICHDGTCSAPCAREGACAALDGLACRLEVAIDQNEVPETVASWCLPENEGGAETGEACEDSARCRTGICHLGACAEVCDGDETCGGELAGGFVCAEVAAYEGGAHVFPDGCPLSFSEAATARLCLPRRGLLVRSLGPIEDDAAVAIDAPAEAASWMLVAEGATDSIVGFDTLSGPGWSDLYNSPDTYEELTEQAVWYYPDVTISSMLVPNTPDMDYVPGTHCAFVRSSDSDVDPEVTTLVKMGPDGDVREGLLDLNFYFMNLEGLGCDVGDLGASTAPTHDVMAWAMDGVVEIFGQVDVEIGALTYHDRTDYPDLDVVTAGDRDQLNALFALGTDSEGYSVDVFFVRTITDALGVAGGIPGPPGRHGLPHAGVAVSMDSACYFSLPNVIAHEVGHLLGLFHTIEQTGTLDNIEDTGTGFGNVMSPGGYGRDLTPGQGFVVRRNANVRWP